MFFNHSISIYNRYYDHVRDVDLYQKTELHNVLWSSQEGYIRRNSSVESDDKIVIYIPFNHEASRVYVNPVDWGNLVDKENNYTINSGSIVVRDVDSPEIATIKELESYFTITSVDYHDFGGHDMSNWEVMAK